MIKHFYLLTTLLFITSPLCHAMKNDLPINQATILTKITAVKNPYTALYLTPHYAFIGGKKKCSIIDIRTNEEIKKISDTWGYSSNISVHPKQKKFAFCTYYPPYYDQKMTIYNAKTYAPEHILAWDMCGITSSSFSSLDDTIAIIGCNKFDVPLYNYKTDERSIDATLYNYKTDEKSIIDIKKADHESQKNYDQIEPVISFHPTKPLMCFAWKNLYIFNLETSETTTIDCNTQQQYHNFCEYSPDGSFIARGTNSSITITNLDPLTHKTLINEPYKTTSGNLAIHPNSKILITLSKPAQFLRYWKIKTSELINTTTVPSEPSRCYNEPSLSICPTGTKLLLTLNLQCFEIAIPFEAQYENLAKDTGIFAHLALQHYLYDGTNKLPMDIRHLLINTLLKASEY